MDEVIDGVVEIIKNNPGIQDKPEWVQPIATLVNSNNAVCKSCGETHKLYAKGLCQKCFKHEWYLKTKDPGKAHVYYWKHRDHILKRVQAYRNNPANREKIAITKDAWRLKNKDRVTESKRAWKQRRKLEIWVQEIGREVKKSSIERDCEVCGMATKPSSLYVFDGKIFCWECLRDYRETSLVPRKRFVFEKVKCPKCGREHPDRRFKNVCIDCRIAEKRKFHESVFSRI